MPAGPELIKAINKQRVLRLVRERSPVSRADLSGLAALTRPTVSALVGELLDGGWVEEVGTGASSGGRRPIMLRFRPEARWVVGAELGAGHIRAVLSDLNGRVHAAVKRRTASGDHLAELGELERAIRQVLDAVPGGEAGLPGPVQGVGIGVNGLVDQKEGLWRYSPHFTVHDFAIRSWLEGRLVLPVWVENDARAMAWGERSFGHGRGLSDLVLVRVGVGIGAGIIIGGEMYGGSDRGAGEFGHTTVDPDGPRCRCGNYGCLEAVANAPAIARRAVRLIRQGRPSQIPELVGGDLEQVIGTTVIEAAQGGDAVAREALAEAGRFLGIGVANLINLLNPPLVVIAGGVGRAGELILEPLRETALSRTLPAFRDRTRILASALGEQTAPLGGAALVLEDMFRVPAVT
jgi:glucokinase-like ROK family protein